MKLVFIGPPGAGKGTQAASVCERYGIPHISTGEILRQEIANGTVLGRQAEQLIQAGQLVPDDVMIGVVRNRLAMADCKQGFLLDGFPRTIQQAEELDRVVDLDLVLNLDIPAEKIVRRISNRRTCKDCSEIISGNGKPKETCPKCGGELFQRDDDTEDTVRSRIQVYETQTRPLLEYYRAQGKLVDIDGDRSVEDVFADICIVLEQYRSI
ncbi:MAG: adenylate kinase [Christensenellales bacterium]|jgi:adenylate kinase